MKSGSLNLEGFRILFAGSGEFGRPALEKLKAAGASLVRVYTQPDKPAGRGHALTPTPIGQWAIEHRVALVRTPDLNSEALPPADLLVVIAFGQKIAPHVIAHARLGAINLHASRLPKFRGAAPINWAILSGEKTTGNSVIRLAQRMDAGAVLGMSELEIGETETAGELHDRLAVDGAELVTQVAGALAAGTAQAMMQEESYATKAPKLSREASRLDWNRDAAMIANQIRGMHPWPGCRVELVDREGRKLDRLTLIRAKVLQKPLPSGVIPGTISTEGTVQCGTGALRLIEVHPDGKRPLPFEAYSRGRTLTGAEQLFSVV